ncbi:hypothetical protein D3C85_1141910 [compost metagenome]
MVEPSDLRFILRHADRMSCTICQQFGPGRSAKLVIDDRQFAALLGKAQHGLGEVGAAGGIHPAGAEDKMASTKCGGLFPCQLGFPIDVERCSLIALDPGALATAIEYVIGRVVDQPCAQRFGFSSNRRHTGRVEQLGKLTFALRLVDRSMGRSVDNNIRFDQTNRFGHPCRVAEITAIVDGVKINGGDAAQRRQCTLQLPAYLTVFAKQQNMHQARSP